MSHRYGPHRDEDAPPTVTVRRPFPHGREDVEVPRAVELQRQRAQINNIAHKAARA